MYHDDYPPPPSSFLVSPAVLRHSISRLYGNPLSSTPSHTRRASKASDIAHLIDPSYSPTGVHHDHNQIYVDHAGEVHDPDFRLFAPAPTHPWKPRVFASDLDDDMEDEEVSLYSTRRQPHRASLDAYPARPCHTAPHPYLATHDPGFVGVPYDDGFGYATDERCETSKLRRRRTRRKESADDVDERRVEWTPTCTHALRRQWLALCLRTQVAAFRARRGVSRAVRRRAAAPG